MKVYVHDFYFAVTGRNVAVESIIKALERWQVPVINASAEGSTRLTRKVEANDELVARCTALYKNEQKAKEPATVLDRLEALETGYRQLSDLLEELRNATHGGR